MPICIMMNLHAPAVKATARVYLLVKHKQVHDCTLASANITMGAGTITASMV